MPDSRRRLRARVVATRTRARSAFRVRNPVVGFCRRIARALLRPQFSQGELMDDQRARGRRNAHHHRGAVLRAGGDRFLALLRQVVAAGGLREHGRADRSGATARRRGPAQRRRHGGERGRARRAKWSLIYIGDGACDAACRTALVFGRQSRLALNNEMTRVQRVFLATGNCCDTQYFATEQPGLIALDASSPEAAALLGAVSGGSAARVVHRRSTGQSHDAARCQRHHHQGPAERPQEAAQAVAHRLTKKACGK